MNSSLSLHLSRSFRDDLVWAETNLINRSNRIDVLLAKGKEEQTDEQLMGLVIQGDSRAFGIIYDRYATRMMRYFYRMLGQDREKAEDFTQDLFTKLVEKPHLFDVTKTFSTWIFSVAHNMCKNEYRRLSVRKVMSKEEPNPNLTRDEHAEDVVRTLDKKTFEKMLGAELELLDENHRTTFLLRFQDELSIKEISEILGISEGTVKSRLFYTVRKLAEKLKVYDLN